MTRSLQKQFGNRAYWMLGIENALTAFVSSCNEFKVSYFLAW
jgi:hypothetical protein